MLTYYRPINRTESTPIFFVMLEEQFKQPETNKVPMATHHKLRLVANNGAIVTL